MMCFHKAHEDGILSLRNDNSERLAFWNAWERRARDEAVFLFISEGVWEEYSTDAVCFHKAQGYDDLITAALDHPQGSTFVINERLRAQILGCREPKSGHKFSLATNLKITAM